MENLMCLEELKTLTPEIVEDFDNVVDSRVDLMKMDTDQSIANLVELEEFQNSDTTAAFDEAFIERKKVEVIINEPAPTPDFMKDKSKYTEYSGDIIETLFEDERIPITQVLSNQLNARHQLVKLMKKSAQFRQMSRSTLHLAVYILDIYMNEFILSSTEEHQKFVAFVILFLAAKSEDLDDKVPSIKEIIYAVDLKDELGYDLRRQPEEEDDENYHNAFFQFAELYCKIEFMIFEAVNFNTIRPTHACFIQAFNSIIATPEDLTDLIPQQDRKIDSFKDLQGHAKDTVKKLLNMTLFHVEFSTMIPSRLAAAIIALTRQQLGIKTVWNRQLEKYLRCGISEIIPIINMMLSMKQTFAVPECDGGDSSVVSDEEVKGSNGDSGFIDSFDKSDIVNFDKSKTEETELEISTNNCKSPVEV